MLARFADAGDVDRFLRLPLVPLEVLGVLNIGEIGVLSGCLPRLQMKRIDTAPGPLLKESHELRILLDRTEDIAKCHIGIDMAHDNAGRGARSRTSAPRAAQCRSPARAPGCHAW